MMIVFGLVWILAGAVLLWGFSRLSRYVGQATVHATGTIIDVRTSDPSRGTIVYSDASGQEYRLPILGPREFPFQEGQRTTLRYDPDDPRRYVSTTPLPQNPVMKRGKTMVTLSACLMIVMGLILVSAGIWLHFHQDGKRDGGTASAHRRPAPYARSAVSCSGPLNTGSVRRSSTCPATTPAA